MSILNERNSPRFNPDLYSFISIFICVAISQLLHLFAKTLSLPLWLEVTGVIVATIMGGLIPGIITAVINSILTAIFYNNMLYLLYLFAGFVIPLVLSLCLKKGYIKNFFSFIGMFFSILIIYSLICSLISIHFFGGYTNYPPVDSILKSFIDCFGLNKFLLIFTLRTYLSFFDFLISSLVSVLFYFILDKYTPFNFR